MDTQDITPLPETPPTQTAPTTPKLTTPMAIIVAGLIIAASIFITNGGTASGSGVRTVAERAGLSSSKLRACLSSGKYKDAIEASSKEGLDLDINGTPFSVITTKSNVIAVISGALPYSYWKLAIDTLPVTPAAAGSAYIFDPEHKKYVVEKFGPFRTPDAKDHILGSLTADMVITEYSDTECPYCKSVHPTLHQLVNDYNGKIAWVYRHFPLDSIHPKTRHEAEAIECATEQGGNNAFWKYTDALFEATPSNNGLDPEIL